MLQRTHLLWYAAGAATYLTVLLALFVTSFTRPKPDLAKLEDNLKEIRKDISKTLEEIRGDKPEWEYAKPMEHDLTRYLSKSYDGTARLLTLHQKKIRESDLAKVNTLGDDLHVSFEKSDVPAGALRHFKGMQLAELSFVKSSLEDEGVAELPLLAGVPKLRLDGSRVTDKGMPHAANIPGLRELYLRDLAITDAGLEALVKAPWLERLDLSGTKVSGRVFAKFPDHSTLQVLDLSRTNVGDDTIEYVLRFKLKDLNLSGTTVSDSGLEKIRGPFPRFVNLQKTRVTPQGAAALKRRVPSISVLYESDPVDDEVDKIKKQIDDVTKGLPKF